MEIASVRCAQSGYFLRSMESVLGASGWYCLGRSRGNSDGGWGNLRGGRKRRGREGGEGCCLRSLPAPAFSSIPLLLFAVLPNISEDFQDSPDLQNCLGGLGKFGNSWESSGILGKGTGMGEDMKEGGRELPAYSPAFLPFSFPYALFPPHPPLPSVRS